MAAGLCGNRNSLAGFSRTAANTPTGMTARAKIIFSSPLTYWAVIFNVLGIFTWGFGPLTFVCLLTAAYVMFALVRGRAPATVGRDLFAVPDLDAPPGRKLKFAFYFVIGMTLVGALVGLLVAPNTWLMDIALNTYLAAENFAYGVNPYGSLSQAWHTMNAGTPHVEVRDGQVYMFGVPYYYGYPYFPAMMLGYLPFTFFIDGYDSIRIGNVVFALANVYGLCLLMKSARRLILQMIVIVAYLCIGVYWIEIFWHGIVDVLLSTFLIYAFVCLQRDQYVGAGIFLGLAQAAKLLPAPLIAVCILYYLFRRPGFWKFSIAYALTGVAVVLPFLLWDPQAFLSATILFYLSFHSVGDNTSLWYFLPEILQAPFLWSGYLATLVTIFLFIRRKTADWVDVMAAAFASYLVFVAFSKMSHLNYLWGVYPLGCAAFAILLGRLSDHAARD